jgi:hypothetical protein
MTDTTWTFGDAVRQFNTVKAQQAKAEATLRDAWKDYAAKERAYRVALAKRITELRRDGVAATTCSDLARGADDIAQLREAAHLAEGVRDAAQSALWRHSGNRHDARSLAEWSMRRELAENGAPDPTRAQDDMPVIGRRAA